MKNQDMPANPQSFSMSEADFGTILTHLTKNESKQSMGETKFEKAFWQVYSAFLSNSNVNVGIGLDGLAKEAIKAVNAGFKTLEERDND